jgi:hypothetical protein
VPKYAFGDAAVFESKNVVMLTLPLRATKRVSRA